MSKIFDGDFCKNSEQLKAVNNFRKKLHHTRFFINNTLINLASVLRFVRISSVFSSIATNYMIKKVDEVSK